ncbi:hypothetical protein SELMODRAFT_404191 [Selaginella moellendorffii]|uniref:Uncharacterized protein n=1 Tax=Selaginella moellendorffii TaxID=88036 RepID=D8QUJ7_SELML|nr:hypothetical protein SELMODRAFT_404191 [Selaginella moellendorffii]
MDRPLAFRFVALVDRAKTPSAISSALACPCFGDLPSEGSEMRGPEAPRSSHIDGADTKITTQDGGVHAASLTSRGREEGDAKIATATSLSGATNMLEQMRQIWLSGQSCCCKPLGEPFVVALACGVAMLVITELSSASVLRYTASYLLERRIWHSFLQLRGTLEMVAQSASLESVESTAGCKRREWRWRCFAVYISWEWEQSQSLLEAPQEDLPLVEESPTSFGPAGFQRHQAA